MGKKYSEIKRAYGLLNNAHMVSFGEFIELISLVRLGSSVSLVDVPLEVCNSLLANMQPATMNCANGEILTTEQRDLLRAEQIREVFAL